jgi:hypothetical protein
MNGRKMERKLVTEKELVRLLNEELAKEDNSEGYSFMEGVIRLVDTDENGCNWSEVSLRGSGVPVKPMLPTADRIIAEAKSKYNLR